MNTYTSFFKKNLEIKLILQFFLGASAGTGVPRNTHKIGIQCGCEYGYKNYESFGSLLCTCKLPGTICIRYLLFILEVLVSRYRPIEISKEVPLLIT